MIGVGEGLMSEEVAFQIAPGALNVVLSPNGKAMSSCRWTGWTSERIAAAFAREPKKAWAVLLVIEELLTPGVSDRPHWTSPRLADEIEKANQRISKSRFSAASQIAQFRSLRCRRFYL